MSSLLRLSVSVVVLSVPAIWLTEQVAAWLVWPLIWLLVVAAATTMAALLTIRDDRLLGKGPWPWLPRPCGADESGVRLRLRRRVLWADLLHVTDLGHRGWVVRHVHGQFGLDPASRHQRDLHDLIVRVLDASDGGRLAPACGLDEPPDESMKDHAVAGLADGRIYRVPGLNKGVAALVSLACLALPAVPWLTSTPCGPPVHLGLWLLAAIGIYPVWRAAGATQLVQLRHDGLQVTDRAGRTNTVLYRDVHLVEAHSGGQMGYTLYLARGELNSFHVHPTLPYGYILPRIEACPESYGGPVRERLHADVPDAAISPADPAQPEASLARALSPAEPTQVNTSDDA